MSMLTHLFRLKPILLVLILAILLSPSQYSTRAIDDFQKTCQFESLDQAEKNLPQDEYRKILQSCLDYYERYYQIQEGVYQTQLDKTQGQRQSLESELSYLESKINTLKVQTQRSQLVVRDLNVEIGDKVDSINITQERIEGYRQELADIIQLTHQYDQQPITLEILAGGQNLSDIFRNFAVLDSLSGRLQELLKGAEDLKIYLKDQQDQKEIEKNNLEQEIVLQSLQEEGLHSTQESKDSLLEKTKGQEDLYQAQLKKVQTEARSKVGEIQSRLFRLIDVPQGGIQFGQAVKVAESVSQLAGIRPAFLLAILAQESSAVIGANVGGCYLVNTKTGAGVYIKTGGFAPKTMKPTRDVPLFLDLTKKLGKDYKTTPVSCCMFRNGQPWGWGGAMGPAQFIPSTWALYQDKIPSLLGKGTSANPWAIQDSFLAAALYLKDLGANGTYRGELNAALSYFGCHTAWCVANYGKPVLNRASQYEKDIETIHQAE
jgi:peptidoglycan hydrolase CwlO-like protein